MNSNGKGVVNLLLAVAATVTALYYGGYLDAGSGGSPPPPGPASDLAAAWRGQEDAAHEMAALLSGVVAVIRSTPQQYTAEQLAAIWEKTTLLASNARGERLGDIAPAGIEAVRQRVAGAEKAGDVQGWLEVVEQLAAELRLL